MSETTRRTEHNNLSTLYLAFELGNKQWKLGFTIGLGQRPRGSWVFYKGSDILLSKRAA